MVIIGGLRQCFMGDWLTAAQHVPFTSRDGLTMVAIYGAGIAGNQLVAVLRLGLVMRPVSFIDDESIADRSISGLQVYKPKHIQQMIDVTGAQEILLVLPSSTCGRCRETLKLLEGFPLHIRSIPNFTHLASGQVKVKGIKEVDIADLLGRDSVSAHRICSRCVSMARPPW
jgi:FlaA1/EpsC-like NDP-sugar epimerase